MPAVGPPPGPAPIGDSLTAATQQSQPQPSQQQPSPQQLPQSEQQPHPSQQPLQLSQVQPRSIQDCLRSPLHGLVCSAQQTYPVQYWVSISWIDSPIPGRPCRPVC